MDTGLFISFLLVSFLLIVIPGPNVLLIISTSISLGKSHGLAAVAGTSSAMAIQLIAAALITSSIVQEVAQGFYIIKWFGVAYLVYLAVSHFKHALSTLQPIPNLKSTTSFVRGFSVSITNPKTILFFSAFLPQFVASEYSYSGQIAILSLSFLFLAVILDTTYAILANYLRTLFSNPKLSKIQHGMSGLIYLLACLCLANAKRT